MAVDVATRSILAGIIAPTTKAVDAAAVLARMLVPEPMRPGWSESLHHAHSVIPHERLLSIDERFANAAAKPVIIPETINCDRGRVYLSETFLRACVSLGISVQPARPYTGSDKSHRGADVRVDQHPVLPARGRVRRAGHHPPRPGRRGGGHLDGRPAAGAVRRVGDRLLAEPAARGPQPHLGRGPGPLPQRDVRRLRRHQRLRPAPPHRRRLHRAPARRLPDRQRLRAHHRQPDLRLQGPQPLPAAGLGPARREQEEMGGPLRPLRHHRRLAARPPLRRVDHRPVGLPVPGRAAVRPRPVGARPADDHRAVRSPPGRGGHRQERRRPPEPGSRPGPDPGRGQGGRGRCQPASTSASRKQPDDPDARTGTGRRAG